MTFSSNVDVRICSYDHVYVNNVSLQDESLNVTTSDVIVENWPENQNSANELDEHEEKQHQHGHSNDISFMNSQKTNFEQ